MQAKMRSLLRLLVKSIIRNRERQADATAAREAHHSPSPTVDPSVQNTQDTGTLGVRTNTHAYIPHTQTHRKRGIKNGRLAPQNKIQHFYCH